MKMKDAIKLGIGFYIGKQLAFDIDNYYLKLVGLIQDKYIDTLNEFEKTNYLRKMSRRDLYIGTKYRKQTVSNKKNPIGFV